MRTPSLKKSIKARITGRAKRAVKKQVSVFLTYSNKTTGGLINGKSS